MSNANTAVMDPPSHIIIDDYVIGSDVDSTNKAYELVKKVIFGQAYKFYCQFGGDLDDLVGDANLAFMQGHTQFMTGKRPSGSPLDVPYAEEIRRWVWFRLFDSLRSKIRRQEITTISFVDNIDEVANEIRYKPGTCIDRPLINNLGEDALFVARLLLDPDAGVETESNTKGGCPHNYRSTIRSYLKSNGWWVPCRNGWWHNPHSKWTNERINKAFDEIRRSLG
jgi:hypothetical protein